MYEYGCKVIDDMNISDDQTNILIKRNINMSVMKILRYTTIFNHKCQKETDIDIYANIV